MFSSFPRYYRSGRVSFPISGISQSEKLETVGAESLGLAQTLLQAPMMACIESAAVAPLRDKPNTLNKYPFGVQVITAIRHRFAARVALHTLS